MHHYHAFFLVFPYFLCMLFIVSLLKATLPELNNAWPDELGYRRSTVLWLSALGLDTSVKGHGALVTTAKC